MPCNNYQFTRRHMLKTFSASILGMPISQLLGNTVADATGKAKAEHVILFWNSGGMSHLDTWDPKPGRKVQGEFNPIKTSVEGMEISEIFPQLAKQMHHGALIRSIAGTNGDHGRAQYELQTGFNQSPNIMHPGLGSLVVHEREPLGDLPALVSISGQAARAGYLGQQCEAYFVGRPGQKDPYLAFPEGISHARGMQRLQILEKMNARTSKEKGAQELKASQTALKNAVNLMESPALKAFDLQDENAKTVEKYGNTEFGRGALLARRLVEKGVRFVQVNRGGFDNHGNIFEAMRNHGAAMDPAIASLISDLKANGMLSKTLVVVLSEFGRTPRINDGGGRDHWARCFSCMMAGGGIKGGSIIGASDEDGMAPVERPVKVSDLHATLCHALGINPSKEVYTPQGRPMRLVRKEATPISELFA
jgi:ribosomal protein L18